MIIGVLITVVVICGIFFLVRSSFGKDKSHSDFVATRTTSPGSWEDRIRDLERPTETVPATHEEEIRDPSYVTIYSWSGEHKSRCPSCGGEFEPHAVICHICGHTL